MSTVFGVTLFLGVVIVLSLWSEPVAYFADSIEMAGYAAYGTFVALLILATVAAPLTALPLVPIAAQVFGPFITGLLSIAGWTLGAVIAFGIARTLGAPLAERLTAVERIAMRLAGMPVGHRLLLLVVLRMVVPVDIASYALGVIPTIRFSEYLLTTIVGVAYFSFVFAYLGTAALEGQWLFFALVGVGSAVLFYFGWAILRRHL